MSVLERIREMSSPPRQQTAQTVLPVSTEDAETKQRRKAGVLAAFGLTDKDIANTLFLSIEQVVAIRETPEFRESCAKQTQERTQRLIDLEEGWDSIESLSTAQVLQHLMYSRDPEYALKAAITANRAHRRSPSSMGRVIDASNVGNVITLTVNKNYITNVTQDGKRNGTIDLQAVDAQEIPRKASDISSPKRLTEILQVNAASKEQEKIARLAEAVGISLDELDEIMPHPNV